MGSIAVTTGTVYVRDCQEVKSILKALDGLTEGMDERHVESRKANRREYGRGVLEMHILISGHTSGSHACKIDDKINGNVRRITSLSGAMSRWRQPRAPTPCSVCAPSCPS